MTFGGKTYIEYKNNVRCTNVLHGPANCRDATATQAVHIMVTGLPVVKAAGTPTGLTVSRTGAKLLSHGMVWPVTCLEQNANYSVQYSASHSEGTGFKPRPTMWPLTDQRQSHL